MYQIREAEDNTPDTKGQLINYIVSNFYRFINDPALKDDRSLLLLIAALSTISASGDDNPSALAAARRLTQNAVMRQGRGKKEKV